MSEKFARGYMLQSTLAFIEKTYEPSVRERMLADVSPRVRDVLANLNTVAWYPVSDVAELFRVIAEHHQRTDGKLRESYATGPMGLAADFAALAAAREGGT